MLKLALSLIIVFGISTGTAQAACPAPVPGNTAGEIRANSERIVCLQNELAAETRRRNLQMQIDAAEKLQQDLMIQRQVPAPPPVPVYEAPAPAPALNS